MLCSRPFTHSPTYAFRLTAQKLGGRSLAELVVGALAHQNPHVREGLLTVLMMSCL